MKDGARTTSELVDCPAAEILHRQKTSDMIENVAEPKTLCHPDWDRGGLSACAASRSGVVVGDKRKRNWKGNFVSFGLRVLRVYDYGAQNKGMLFVAHCQLSFRACPTRRRHLLYVLLHGTLAERKEVVPRQCAEGLSLYVLRGVDLNNPISERQIY